MDCFAGWRPADTVLAVQKPGPGRASRAQRAAAGSAQRRFAVGERRLSGRENGCRFGDTNGFAAGRHKLLSVYFYSANPNCLSIFCFS